MRQPYREGTAMALKCVEIPGDANEWLACKKQGEFFIVKKSVLVLYYLFFERSPNLSEIFFKAEEKIYF